MANLNKDNSDGRVHDDDRHLQDPLESDDDIPLVHPCNEDKLAEVNAVFYSMFIDSASSAKKNQTKKLLISGYIVNTHKNKHLTKRMINKKMEINV